MHHGQCTSWYAATYELKHIPNANLPPVQRPKKMPRISKPKPSPSTQTAVVPADPIPANHIFLNIFSAALTHITPPPVVARVSNNSYIPANQLPYAARVRMD